MLRGEDEQRGDLTPDEITRLQKQVEAPATSSMLHFSCLPAHTTPDHCFPAKCPAPRLKHTAPTAVLKRP